MHTTTRTFNRRSPRHRVAHRPVRAETESARIPLVLIVCAAILVVGFFFAARQHFASIEYGIKNSALRSQIEQLEAENRRLQLVREVALSPGEIRKVARRMGFVERTAANIGTFRPGRLSPETGTAVKAAKPEGSETKVIKTVISAPVQSKGDKSAKNESDKKDRSKV